MSLSLILTFSWIILANLLAILPSSDNYWRRAYFLIAIGVPLLGYVTYQNGPWVGLFALGAAMSMLRWPMVYLWRWIKRKIAG